MNTDKLQAVTSIGVHDRPIANPRDPKKIHDAACQFESLMIAEMLKTAKEDASGGCFGEGDQEDAAGGLATGMGQEFLAQAIAAKGGLGLAATIERGLQSASQRQAIST